MFAATAVEQDKAAMPALIPDRRLQDAPCPWILQEEVLHDAFLKVDHQESRARSRRRRRAVRDRRRCADNEAGAGGPSPSTGVDFGRAVEAERGNLLEGRMDPSEASSVVCSTPALAAGIARIGSGGCGG